MNFPSERPGDQSSERSCEGSIEDASEKASEDSSERSGDRNSRKDMNKRTVKEVTSAESRSNIRSKAPGVKRDDRPWWHRFRSERSGVGSGLRFGSPRNKRFEFEHEAQAALDRGDVSVPLTSGIPDVASMRRGERGSLTREGMSLADLKPGECGYISHLVGSTQNRLRLLEMGMTPGTHVQVLRAAAFGGPLDVNVRGYHLSLRREEAMSVWLGGASVMRNFAPDQE